MTEKVRRTRPPYILLARNLLWDHEHRKRMGVSIWTYAQLLDLRTHANGQVLWGRCLTIDRWAAILKCPARTVRRDFETLREGDDPYLTAFGGRGLGLALTVRKSKGWKQDEEAVRRVAETVAMLDRIQRPHPAFAKATSGGSKGHGSGGIRPHVAFPIIREGNEDSPRGSTKETKDASASPSPPMGDEAEARSYIATLRAKATVGDRKAGKMADLLERMLGNAEVARGRV